MISIRVNMFETNSSSCTTLAVIIAQINGLDIPPKVYIKSDAWKWDKTLDGSYALAKSYNKEDEFFGLLKYVGVKEIYLDGNLVNTETTNKEVTFRKTEYILAACFGKYLCFTEVEGYGGEYEESKFLNEKEIDTIQSYIKNPEYIVDCYAYGNEDDLGTSIDWKDVLSSKIWYKNKHEESKEFAYAFGFIRNGIYEFIGFSSENGKLTTTKQSILRTSDIDSFVVQDGGNTIFVFKFDNAIDAEAKLEEVQETNKNFAHAIVIKLEHNFDFWMPVED